MRQAVGKRLLKPLKSSCGSSRSSRALIPALLLFFLRRSVRERLSTISGKLSPYGRILLRQKNSTPTSAGQAYYEGPVVRFERCWLRGIPLERRPTFDLAGDAHEIRDPRSCLHRRPISGSGRGSPFVRNVRCEQDDHAARDR